MNPEDTTPSPNNIGDQSGTPSQASNTENIAPPPTPTEPEANYNPVVQPVVTPDTPVAPVTPAQTAWAQQAQSEFSAAAPSSASANDSSYISNPFLVTIRELISILRYNPVPVLLAGIAITLMVIALYFIGFAGGAAISPLIAVLALAVGYLVLLPVSIGVFILIGLASSKEEKTTFGQSFSKALGKVFPLIGLTIITALLVGLGLIVFILPGIYLMGRASLAALLLFEEDLGPIAALKRSFELTKGHAIEMLGAIFAGGVLSGNGLLSPAVTVAPLIGRYRDLKTLKESSAPKPKIHWLNYLIPVTLLLLVTLYVGFVITAVRRQATETNNQFQPNSQYFDTQLDSNSLQSDPFADDDFQFNYQQ